MARSRAQKASLNILTSAITEAIALLNTMVLPRLILTHYGSSYNGIATSASQFLSLISVLTLGVTASTRVALYKTLAKDDNSGTSAIVRATERYMRRIGSVLAIYIIALAFLYPLFIKTGLSYFDVALLILVTGTNSFAEYFFGITYRTLLLADQSVYISNIFTAVSTLLSLLVSILLIQAGYSFQVVKIGAAVVYVSKIILQNIYVSTHYKLDKTCEPDLSALKNKSDAMAHALANIVHDNTDIIVLTLFTDVKTVSVYTVYNMVMNAIKKLQMIFSTGTEPIFGNMWAKNEINKVKMTLDIYEFSVAYFCSVVFATTLVMLLPFVSIYTKGVTDIEYIRPMYGFIITSAFAVQCFRVPYLCLVQGIGHYKQTKKAAILEAVINLSLSVVLVNIIGIPGVAIGTLAANLFRTIQYAVYIDHNVVRRGKNVFIGRMVWALLNIVIVAVPAYLVIGNYHFNDWLQWLLAAVIVFAISLVFVTISSLLFYRKEFFDAFKTFKRMAKKTFHR